MSVPNDRWYSEDHEWMRAIDDARQVWAVGLTDFAQDALGEVSLVRLVDPGTHIEQGAEMGEVEAFKAMSDLYMPVSGTIEAFNDRLSAEPTLINADPYGDGWLCQVLVDNPAECSRLLDGAAYTTMIEGP